MSPAIAVLCALGAKAALDRFAEFRWRTAVGVGVTAAALVSAAVLADAGPSWRGAAFAAGATALVTGAVAVGLLAIGRPRQPGLLGRLGRLGPAAWIALALTSTAALAGPLVADGWLLAHRAGPFDVPLSPSGTFAESPPSLVAARLSHPGYAGTIFPTMTAAMWRQLRADGQEYNSLIPSGMWFAAYGSAASVYVLSGVKRVLPVGGFTGSVPSPTLNQLTRMLVRHQIALAEIPGPGDISFNDPRVQAIAHRCFQLDRFGDTTARARLYDCRYA